MLNSLQGKGAEQWLFGIEHEVAFMNANVFGDSTNTNFEALERVVDRLPVHEEDHPKLRVGARLGNLRVRAKRWYVEGLERFQDDGSLLAYLPKCIEVRTTPQATPQAAVQELEESYALLEAEMQKEKLTPVWVSYHPFRTEFSLEPPLTGFEQARYAEHPETRTEALSMLSYGPDLSLSLAGTDDAWLLDSARKLTYYSPFIIPFSFSSPFYNGNLWDGLSVRTYIRTGKRMAVLAFVDDERFLPTTLPPLSRKARSPFEHGRVEFKAFDASLDFNLYASLCVLLKGMLLSENLPGRADVPDAALHQQSARSGFHDPLIFPEAKRVLAEARLALQQDSDLAHISKLDALLEARTSPAEELVREYAKVQSILPILQGYHRQ